MTTHRKSFSSKKHKGGSGAAEYGQAVYGDASQQHAAGPNDNVIAMKHISGGSASLLTPAQLGGAVPLTPAQLGGAVPLTPAQLGGSDVQLVDAQLVDAQLVDAQLGGSDKIQYSALGGNPFVEVGVPAVLLLANNVIKRRKLGKSIRKIGKSIRSVRFSPFNRRSSKRGGSKKHGGSKKRGVRGG
jgi:hypothetical protein